MWFKCLGLDGMKLRQVAKDVLGLFGLINLVGLLACLVSFIC
jgi:hypothetical protein